MSGPGSAWLLVRCDFCGAMQAISVEGGDLLDCCERANRYDASLTYVEQTSEWKPSAGVIGSKPDNYDGLHLEWKQGTDGYWLMLGNKRVAEIAGRDVRHEQQSITALNEFLATIPATPAKEKAA